jgi:hypothetical protein
MREREVREFLKLPREKDLVKLIEIGEKVSEGLKLEEGTPSNFFQERFQIVGVIADTIYETTEFLGTDVPSIGLLYDWNDEKGGKAYARIPAATVKGKIKFSPWFLKAGAMGFARNGIGSKPQLNAFVNTTAHEVYHYYQIERFPNASEKDFRKDMKNYDLSLRFDLKIEKMPHSRSERGALMFGRLVEKIKSRKT